MLKAIAESYAINVQIFSLENSYKDDESAENTTNQVKNYNGKGSILDDEKYISQRLFLNKEKGFLQSEEVNNQTKNEYFQNCDSYLDQNNKSNGLYQNNFYLQTVKITNFTSSETDVKMDNNKVINKSA